MNLADRLHLDGLQALQAEDYGTAIELLDASAKHNPSVPQLHNNRGLVLRKLGAVTDAVHAFRQAILLSPDYTEAHYNLGIVLMESGQTDRAERSLTTVVTLDGEHGAALYALAELEVARGHVGKAASYLSMCIRLDTADRLGASLLLAALGHAALPEKAPEAFIDRLYARRASAWDEQDGYEAPLAVARMVAEAASDDDALSILDLGCGTGLLGQHVRPFSTHLIGVDRSEAMLRIAAAKRVYDRLFVDDVFAFLASCPERFHVITASALLIHFGNLDDVFRQVSRKLGPDSVFVFSLYSYNNWNPTRFALHPDLNLAKAGCFAHGSVYVADSAGRAGLRISTIKQSTHEASASHSAAGLMVTVRPAT